jgi:hypothetical protein
MVLERIGTVSCPGACLDLLDVYELRMWPAGPPVTHWDTACFETCQARPGYRIAREQLRAPMISYFGDGWGAHVMRLFALRSSSADEQPMDLIEV